MDSDALASDELWELVFAAIDHGLDSVRGGSTLVPFAMSRHGDTRDLVRFVADTFEEGVAAARRSVAEAGEDAMEMYAIAFDGYVTYEGVQFDAVLVEAGERGRDTGYRFAQRYRHAAEGEPFSTVGNPLLIDAPRLLFT